MTVFSRTHLTAALAIGAAALVASPAVAQQLLTLQVTVANACSIESGTIQFDTYYSGQQAALGAEGEIIYTGCPAGTTVILGTGEGTYAQRIMLNGSNVLQYSLFKESNYTGDWQPDGLTLSESEAGSGTIPVYALIAGQQSVTAGEYVDNVQITWSF